MRIIIVADIHDNLLNLKKSLVWCKAQKIDELICCGDVCSLETLDYLSLLFPQTIHLVRGNAELYEDESLQKYKNIKYYSYSGSGKFGDISIGFCHEPDRIKKLLNISNCDIVFYGHTHRPWQEKKDRTIMVNPGTLGGIFQRGSFAIYDTKQRSIELKLLELI